MDNPPKLISIKNYSLFSQFWQPKFKSQILSVTEGLKGDVTGLKKFGSVPAIPTFKDDMGLLYQKIFPS